jgi:hypothetical protein
VRRPYYSELSGWEIDAQPMEGVEIGLFKDPEGNIVGLTGRAG